MSVHDSDHDGVLLRLSEMVKHNKSIPAHSITKDSFVPRPPLSFSLGTSPNQGGDRFQYHTPTTGLGYSLSPIPSMSRNVRGQEINVIMKYLRC